MAVKESEAGTRPLASGLRGKLAGRPGRNALAAASGETLDYWAPREVMQMGLQPIIAVDGQMAGVKRALEESGYQVQDLSRGLDQAAASLSAAWTEISWGCRVYH